MENSKKYTVGMFGGSFDPLHFGHLQIIISAAAVCEKLYVVLSYSRNRDSIPMEIRYRWLYNSCKHLSHVKVITLEDSFSSKSKCDTLTEWERGKNVILSQIDGPIDVVFCGSDYKGRHIYEDLYGCDVVYFDRDVINISSSEIRSNPYKYWSYIPEICRPYFVKKVLLVGGESVGKSTLAKNLSLFYNTNYLEEIGREVCDYAGGREDMMIADDFYEILLRHKVRELELTKSSNKILFVDTDALTTSWFSEFLLANESERNRIKDLAEAIQNINTFDLVLFLEPTVAFVQDGTRNEKIAENREKYSLEIKEMLNQHGVSYHCIDGDYKHRFEMAKKLIKEHIGI